MRLSTRLTLAMIALVLLTAATVGELSFRRLVTSIVPVEFDRLQTRADQFAAELDAYVRAARADALALSRSSGVMALARAGPGDHDPLDGTAVDLLRNRLQADLLAVLSAHPTYAQLRLVGAADGGREIVRVDRSASGTALFVVGQDQLQRKGGRNYVQATLALPSGGVHVSRIDLNREHGEPEIPYRPTLRVAAPVHAPDGGAFGILVVNVDMRPVFTHLRTQTVREERLYVGGERGDYLLHPDPDNQFGADLDLDASWLVDFPDLVASERGARWVHLADGTEVAAAPARVSPAGGPPVTVILAMRRARVLASALAVRRSSQVAGAFAVLGAIVLAILLARSLTRPLGGITRELEGFTGEGRLRLPVRAPGEIGVVARALERMAREVGDKTAALRREIDERRRAEAELERKSARERLLAAVVESSSDAILSKDLDGTITSWNPGAERLYGYSAREALGRSVLLIVPDDRREEVASIRERIARGEIIEHFRTVRVSRDGRRIDVSLTVSPVRSGSGAIVGASAIGRDVTAEREAEEKFRLAVEASPSGMVMADHEGRIRMINTECERMFGYERSELLGQPVELLVPQRFRGTHPGHRRGFAAAPEVRIMGAGRELYGVRRDGTEFPVEVGLNPIRTDSGLLTLCVVIDISERKRAGQALAERTAELERSNADLQQFAYIASHDLQEPLRMVVSFTELLEQRYGETLDERAAKYMKYIVEGGKRMQQLVGDLLTYSRVDTRREPSKPIDTNAVVSDILETLNQSIVECQARVELERLPTLVADEVQMGQLFQNLIGNAIKFRADRPPVVRVAAEPGDGSWRFSVQDNGIGIERKHAARIFQMFQRLHERGRYPGSGIGLAIAKKIVEGHGGSIWFESEPGRGTTFFFTLPAKGAEK